MIEKLKNEFQLELPNKDDFSLWLVSFTCPKDTIY